MFRAIGEDEVVETARKHSLDPDAYRPGRHTYYFPAWSMVLWRGTVSDVEGRHGYLFDSVSTHAPGYYDAKTLAHVRERSGLPPEPDKR